MWRNCCALVLLGVTLCTSQKIATSVLSCEAQIAEVESCLEAKMVDAIDAQISGLKRKQDRLKEKIENCFTDEDCEAPNWSEAIQARPTGISNEYHTQTDKCDRKVAAASDTDVDDCIAGKEKTTTKKPTSSENSDAESKASDEKSDAESKASDSSSDENEDEALEDDTPAEEVVRKLRTIKRRGKAYVAGICSALGTCGKKEVGSCIEKLETEIKSTFAGQESRDDCKTQAIWSSAFSCDAEVECRKNLTLVCRKTAADLKQEMCKCVRKQHVPNTLEMKKCLQKATTASTAEQLASILPSVKAVKECYIDHTVLSVDSVYRMSTLGFCDAALDRDPCRRQTNSSRNNDIEKRCKQLGEELESTKKCLRDAGYKDIPEDVADHFSDYCIKQENALTQLANKIFGGGKDGKDGKDAEKSGGSNSGSSLLDSLKNIFSG